MSKRLDLTDQKFNRLYVLEFAYANKWHHSCWKCLCDCGNITTVVGKEIKSGHTKSCGCLKLEKIIERAKQPKSKETRKKLSIANSGKRCGKDNPMYNPDLTPEDRINRRHIPGYKEWVQAVLKRDNYTCQICGDNTGGNLIAHHLESYNSNPKLRTKLSNGTTVCEKHHIDFHHQYGYGNNTRKQFNEFREKFKKENK